MTTLLDGKKLSKEIKLEIAQEVLELKEKGMKTPHLAAILVGTDGASETYVASKVKRCKEVGFESTLVRLEADTSEEILLQKIEELNQDDDIDGFIVQLPLPKHISEQKVIEAIHPDKDVDGFHPSNIGKMTKNLPTLIPATPLGMLMMLERYNIETSGKHCVVIGRSNIVGSPMSILMALNSSVGNATVTVCHSRTKNLKEFTKMADIIVIALGKPGFLTADMIKEGAVILDVGITRVVDETKKRGYAIKGDVAFDEVYDKASYISPVPGGIGLMTVTSLLHNTLQACKNNYNKAKK